MRIGEAANPGPSSEKNRATWGAFTAQDPNGAGFRDAIAPGFNGGVRNPEDDVHAGEELGHFSLKIVTTNITSWGSILDFLAVTSADVLLVQEHKLDAARAEEAVSWLRRRGWNALFAAADTGPNGGNCAGTAILAKAHIGLGLPLVGSEVVSPARAVAARIEPPGGRPIVVVSAYLHDGQGLARGNLELLGRIGSFLGAQGEGCPFVLGADFQVTPEQIAATAMAKELGAVIMATGDANGTCRTASSARELDFFMVSSGLADGVKSVSLVPRTGIRTHVPVELAFKPRLASLRALVVRKPPPLSTERIIGPVRQVADWGDAAHEAAKLALDAMDEGIGEETIHQRLGDLYRSWADEAERELMECVVDGVRMPKTQLRGRAPVMVWRSILPERPTIRRDGIGVRWRNVANATLGLQRLIVDVQTRMQGGARPGAETQPSAPRQPTTDDLMTDEWTHIRSQLESSARETEEARKDFDECDDDDMAEDCARGYGLLSDIADMARRLAANPAEADAFEGRPSASAMRPPSGSRIWPRLQRKPTLNHGRPG